MPNDFTIVTACTPDYAEALKWSMSSWLRKPQFRDRPGIVFIADMKRLPFDLPPNWQAIAWDFPFGNMREKMLSAFVFGAAEHVQTPYYVKLDADAYFIDDQDVFTQDDFPFDLVAQRWGYTKPGWWVDKLDAMARGDRFEDRKDREKRKDARIISFCCLHNMEFVRKAALLAGNRLPVPSHDTYLWWLADRCKEFRWVSRDLKARGVRHERKWKSIRNAVCATDGAWDGPAGAALFDHIQLEITWACNLACPNCDRACGAAPSKERLSLEQVRQFVADCQAAGKTWRRIDILGGEPTLHPDLLPILEAVRPIAKRVRLTTNGTGPFVAKVLATVPDWVLVRNSHDAKEDPNFEAFTVAPKDQGVVEAKCCSIPWRCGIALTPRGYFLCGSGAAVDRVFALHTGINQLADFPASGFERQRNALCNLCGHSRSVAHRTKELEVSPSWKKALEEYNAQA